MKKFRRAACLLLCVLLIGAISAPVLAAEEYEDNGGTYEDTPQESDNGNGGADQYIPVSWIDEGTYSPTMNVGQTQQLYPVPMPENASNRTVTYTSKNSSVLLVDDRGLVTALSAGTAEIEIRADSCCITITVSVNDSAANTPASIPVSDIDYDYQPSMYVGSNQLLTASVIPVNADEQEISFSSSDSSVLSVNAVGRVYAMAAGSAQITMSAGGISRTVTIRVMSSEDETDSSYDDSAYVDSGAADVSSGIEKVAVSSIDVADWKGKVAIDDDVTISATVYPTDATEQQLKYSSSNTAIAAVSAGGRVTGVSKGECTIVVSAGGVSKSLALRVYQKTTGFDINKSYVMLQTGKTFQVEASAQPEDADQEITFSSTDDAVLTVDENGLITAVGTGYASVIVKNFDSEAVVTVVVNSLGASDADGSETDAAESVTVEYNDDSQQLAQIILGMEKGETISIDGDGLDSIGVDVLSALYASKAKLQVIMQGYELLIDGQKIENPGNALDPVITLEPSGKTAEFCLNDGSNLPGEVEISLDEDQKTYRHLYILNESTGKYVKLDAFDGKTMTLDVAGTYMLTSARYRDGGNAWWILWSGLGVCIAAGVGLLYNKKYWFW